MTRSKDSDPSLNPVIELLRVVKKDVGKTKETVDNMNRELGGVQATLNSMEKRNVERDKKIDSVQTEQLSCPARAGYGAVNARLKKHDKALFDSTGTVNIPVVPAVSAAAQFSESEISFKDALIRMLPIIALSFACGAGMLAILWYRMFGE